jgi:purine nucleoside permease
MIPARTIPLLLATCALLSSPLLASSAVAEDAGTIPLRVVVVTTFDIEQNGQDQGGEFHAWTDQYPLPVHIRFPQGYHELRYNSDDECRDTAQ